MSTRNGALSGDAHASTLRYPVHKGHTDQIDDDDDAHHHHTQPQAKSLMKK